MNSIIKNDILNIQNYKISENYNKNFLILKLNLIKMNYLTLYNNVGKSISGE